jgi:hypothetical protein
MLTFEDKKDIANIVDGAIDKFALTVAKGFSGVDKKFDEMEEKMDKKFEIVDGRLDKIDQTLGGIQVQIGGIHNRIDDVVENYAKKSDHLRLEKRVKKLETKLAS